MGLDFVEYGRALFCFSPSLCVTTAATSRLSISLRVTGGLYDLPVRMVRHVIVFDAADLHAESAFWAGILGGRVFEDDRWHSVIDAAGDWRIGVQLAPNHVPPDWPDGSPQQLHLDLHVDDPRAAHEEAMALAARLLQPADDLDADEGHQIYAARLDIRSASAGGTRLQKRSEHSSPTAAHHRNRRTGPPTAGG